MATLALIDYGSGNLHSAERALRAAARAAGMEIEISVTSSADKVLKADRIVLPGVGHFADCARNLFAEDGLISALDEAVRTNGTPFLGICVGLQLLASRGLEDGITPGLDWISGDVDRIRPTGSLQVPHMGWNGLRIRYDHPVFEGLGEDPHVYFTHSYAFEPASADDVIATCDYGGDIVAAIGRDNLVATQFHPEKSQKVGLQLLSNFLNWTP
jgi:glutamine amidotransferase